MRCKRARVRSSTPSIASRNSAENSPSLPFGGIGRAFAKQAFCIQTWPNEAGRRRPARSKVVQARKQIAHGPGVSGRHFLRRQRRPVQPGQQTDNAGYPAALPACVPTAMSPCRCSTGARHRQPGGGQRLQPNQQRVPAHRRAHRRGVRATQIVPPRSPGRRRGGSVRAGAGCHAVPGRKSRRFRPRLLPAQGDADHAPGQCTQLQHNGSVLRCQPAECMMPLYCRPQSGEIFLPRARHRPPTR